MRHITIMTDRSTAESFTTRQATAITGIPPGTIASWAKRGRLSALDAQFGERGRAVLFSRRDLLALSILRGLSVSGIYSGGAGGENALEVMVSMAADHWLKFGAKLKGMHVLVYPDHRVTMAYGAQLGTPEVPDGAEITLSIDLDGMLGRTQAQIDRLPRSPVSTVSIAKFDEAD